MGIALGAVIGLVTVEELFALSGGLFSPAGLYAMLLAIGGLTGSAAGFSYAAKKQAAENHKLFLSYAVDAARRADDRPFPDANPSQVVEKPSIFPITTILYTDDSDGLIADTHEREEILASARKALLSMDHTKITVH
jgi:hypothetical protein